MHLFCLIHCYVLNVDPSNLAQVSWKQKPSYHACHHLFFFFCLLSPLKKWNQKCFLSFRRNHKCHFGSTGLLRIHACLFVHTLLINQQPFRDQVRKWVHTIIISNSVRGHLNSMTVLYFIYVQADLLVYSVNKRETCLCRCKHSRGEKMRPGEQEWTCSKNTTLSILICMGNWALCKQFPVFCNTR